MKDNKLMYFNAKCNSKPVFLLLSEDGIPVAWHVLHIGIPV